jgi:hypothetical protein
VVFDRAEVLAEAHLRLLRPANPLGKLVHKATAKIRPRGFGGEMRKARERRPKAAGEFATPPRERGQHDELEVVNHDPQNIGARRVQVKLPNRLQKYVALKSITPIMAQAGEALGDDWEHAGLVTRTTANLMGNGGGYKQMTDSQVDAYKRLQKALGGKRLKYADMLISTCCFDLPANTRVLRTALTKLAQHYGLLGYPQKR